MLIYSRRFQEFGGYRVLLELGPELGVVPKVSKSHERQYSRAGRQAARQEGKIGLLTFV